MLRNRLHLVFFFLLLAIIATIPIHAAQDLAPGLTVHFINVGQGDSIFIASPDGQNILIDAGDGRAAGAVVRYLHDRNVTKVDYLIATHPHEDHIGGMVYVLRQFPVDKVYMPRASHTTRTYRTLLTTIQELGLKITEAKAGVTLDVGPDIVAAFIAPNENSYDNLNNYSAVLRLVYGDSAFLFAGDAEALSEREMTLYAEEISADVLKVGHHGSDTSTTEDFLVAVAPVIAVISVGNDNPYGHPHASVLERLALHGVQVYRTDQHGTVVVSSSDQRITVAIEKAAPPVQTSTGIQYIGNKNTRKFHLPTCKSLPLEKNQVYFESRAKAIEAV